MHFAAEADHIRMVYYVATVQGAHHILHKIRMEQRHFSCAVCSNTYPYIYHGKKPPFCSQVEYHEVGYIFRDPFASYPLPLFMGSTCSVCDRTVCADPACSFYYMKRMCISCIGERKEDMPSQVLGIVEKYVRKRAAQDG